MLEVSVCALLNYTLALVTKFSHCSAKVSANQANLYGGTATGFSSDSAIAWYLKSGATASKITMGIPLYGRSFEATSGIDQTFSGVRFIR